METPQKRTALVTGAGRGIGKGIALSLAGQGHRLVLGARTKKDVEAVAGEIRKKGTDALALSMDVTDPKSVEKAFADARAKFGSIEILINNAGTAKSAPILKTSLELWNELLAVNLTGTFLCTKEALPSMLEKGWGRVVNIASISGKMGAPYISAYAASKHGVLGFTRSVAQEVEGKGVTVNAICPGYVDTPLTQKSIQNIVDRTGMSAAQARKRLEEKNVSGKLISPEEVALKVLELCSEKAAGINGAAIDL